MKLKILILSLLLLFGNWGIIAAEPSLNQTTQGYEFLLTENTYEYEITHHINWDVPSLAGNLSLTFPIIEKIIIDVISDDEISGFVVYYAELPQGEYFRDDGKILDATIFDNRDMLFFDNNFSLIHTIDMKGNTKVTEITFNIDIQSQNIVINSSDDIYYIQYMLGQLSNYVYFPLISLDVMFQERTQLFRSDISHLISGDTYECEIFTEHSEFRNYTTYKFENDNIPTDHYDYHSESEYHSITGAMLRSRVDGSIEEMTYSFTKSMTQDTIINMDNGDPIVIAPEPTTITEKDYSLQFDVFEPFPKRYTLYVNSEEYYSKQMSRDDSSFDLSLTLDKGNTTLTLEVEDDFGHITSASTWVFRDETVVQIVGSFIVPILIVAIPILIWRRRKR